MPFGLKPTTITKNFLKLRRKGEAFYFKPFQCIDVFNAVLPMGIS
jgi:hypothetical protein